MQRKIKKEFVRQHVKMNSGLQFVKYSYRDDADKHDIVIGLWVCNAGHLAGEVYDKLAIAEARKVFGLDCEVVIG